MHVAESAAGRAGGDVEAALCMWRAQAPISAPGGSKLDELFLSFPKAFQIRWPSGLRR